MDGKPHKEDALCSWCLEEVPGESFADIVKGPLMMTCGCVMHRRCVAAILLDGEGLVCMCTRVSEQLKLDAARGVATDVGTSNLVQAFQACALIARPSVPKPVQTSELSEKPHLPVLHPKPSLLDNRPPPPAREEIPGLIRARELSGLTTVAELVRRGVTLDMFLNKYDRKLMDVVDLLDISNAWEQLLLLGMRWDHLKNREKMPPELLSRLPGAGTAQFLSLFVTKEDLEGFKPALGQGSALVADRARRAKLRENPLKRLKELGYTPAEYGAFGVRLEHIVNVFEASVDDAAELYKRNPQQAEIVWGTPPHKRALLQ